MGGPNAWVACPRPNPRAKLRLFCLPYSGANASVYYGWAGRLPSDAELCAVELPGHGRRLAEPLTDEMGKLVQQVADGLAPYLDRPFAIFGHSMGALLGFELSRHLQRSEALQPRHLFVSGHVAPQLAEHSEPIHDLPREDFFQRIHDLEGTPELVLENRELQDLVMPILRADFKVCETYSFRQGEPLECPMTALGGLSDKFVSRKDLEDWGWLTRGPFSVRMFPGGHFFINVSATLVLDALASSLDGAVR
jgi:medium-chain acyl-[acyl-carrier-protein] hydrolase